MRKENVATGPPGGRVKEYLMAKTFCLGFPQYKADSFAETLEIIEAVREKKIPYRGRAIASKNQIIKDLVVYGLALSGNKQALERIKQKGFILEDVKNGNARTVT